MNKKTSKSISLVVLCGLIFHAFLNPVVAMSQSGTTQMISDIEATPAVTALPETPGSQEIETEIEPDSLSYSQMMRKQRSMRLMKVSSFLQFEPINNLLIEEEKTLHDEMERFIELEEAKLDQLDVPAEKKDRYLSRLRKQKDELDRSHEATMAGKPKEAEPEMKIPKKQSEFSHDIAPVTVESLNITKMTYKDTFNATGAITKDKPSSRKTTFNSDSQIWSSRLQKLHDGPISSHIAAGLIEKSMNVAHAAIAYADLPVLSDVLAAQQPADSETAVNSEIQGLADSLERNPVKIVNFVRNNISYEPYYGAKKGAIGCLREKVCNDTDTSSLTIALLRAAGMPARYKKSLIVMPVEQMQNLLGVDETKTVYAALSWNKVPVYLVSGETVTGGSLDSYDFSNESELALEWTFVEAFYDYDERGGNRANDISFIEAGSDDKVREILQNHPEKQWIPVDAVIRPYTHQENEIAHVVANFNVENFWNSFLAYQGELAPMAKFAQDLQAASGKDINSVQFQSTRTGNEKSYDILPPVPPYQLAVDVNGTIVPEAWSRLPDQRKISVKVSLLKESDSETVLTHTFFGSEINNVPFNLQYEGATETDKAIIESYGGIHATPADLVEIRPQFAMDYAHYDGDSAAPVLQIGDPLILQFELNVKGETIHTSQKFSIAGNTEGIYLVLSRVLGNAFLDDETDPDFNSKVLLEGNAELARQYLRRVQSNSDLLQKVMDRSANTHIMRAVITQNRVLSKVDGIPTTFDFKGLTIDAETYIAGYSNRGNYKTLEKDFHLLWGLQASYDEAAIFKDITGLEAISTVQGIRYANATPANYQVNEITSANESVIDTLALSANTKANMHADVQAGRKVITPNKAVTQGTFTGVLYISIAPNGTGTYAIGEQSQQNGGWMIEGFNESAYCDNGACAITYKAIQGARIYIYEDQKNKGLSCNMNHQDFVNLQMDPTWDPSFGVPCYIAPQNLTFGDVSLSFKIATNATKFWRGGTSGYEYWKKSSDIYSMMSTYVSDMKAVTQADIDAQNPNYPDLKLIRIADPNFQRYPNFRFSLATGTYLQGICEVGQGITNCPDNDEGALYYSPDQSGGAIYRAKGNIFSKMSENGNKVAMKIGFPVGHERYAAPSGMVNSYQQGTWQEFIDGQIYSYNTWWVKPNYFYTFGKLFQMHASSGGTAGSIGFPVTDPMSGVKSIGGQVHEMVYQGFEDEKEVEWDKSTGSAQIVEARKYRCEMNYEGANLNWITVHGVIDSGLLMLGDAADLGNAVWSFATYVFTTNPISIATDTGKAIAAVYDALATFDIDKFINDFNYITNSAIESLKTELEEAWCPARQHYISGRIVGEIALIVIPAAKITAAAKLKLLEKGLTIIGKAEKISDLGYWGRTMRFLDQVDREEWMAIKAIANSNEKGQRAEEFMQRILGGVEGKREVTSLGERLVDVWDENRKLANEIKIWSNNVSYSGDVKQQILKDIELMNTLGADNYKPVWHFLDKGPTGQFLNDIPNGGLLKELEDAGIEYIIYE